MNDIRLALRSLRATVIPLVTIPVFDRTAGMTAGDAPRPPA